MREITVGLSDESMRKLKELSERFNIAPEDLARVSIEELLNEPEDEFVEAARHILEKNKELYKRLA